MPRMGKKDKLYWSFFLNDRGRITYNAVCRRCQHSCKQSFQAEIVNCPHYLSKRSQEHRMVRSADTFTSINNRRR